MGWRDEIKESGYLLDEAPPPQIVELVADPPVPGQPQSYHLRQEGEEVPAGVISIQAVEVSPGVFRPVAEVLQQAQQHLQQQQQQQQHSRIIIIITFICTKIIPHPVIKKN